jgi:hypothetical protein
MREGTVLIRKKAEEIYDSIYGMDLTDREKSVKEFERILKSLVSDVIDFTEEKLKEAMT